MRRYNQQFPLTGRKKELITQIIFAGGSYLYNKKTVFPFIHSNSTAEDTEDNFNYYYSCS